MEKGIEIIEEKKMEEWEIRIRKEHRDDKIFAGLFMIYVVVMFWLVCVFAL